MSTLAPAPFSASERSRAHPAPSLLDGLGGEPTLDELLSGVWEGLAAHRLASCPVCGDDMSPEYGAHAIQPDDSGAVRPGSRMTRARPEPARQDAERAASSSGRRAGRVPEGGRCRTCETTLS